MNSEPTMFETIRARVSPSQKDAVAAAAKRRGMTLSAFVRDVALRATGQTV
jgi:uncharacterized protein (DUF1778 family)